MDVSMPKRVLTMKKIQYDQNIAQLSDFVHSSKRIETRQKREWQKFLRKALIDCMECDAWKKQNQPAALIDTMKQED